jgi:opacity protein-like surface antigen
VDLFLGYSYNRIATSNNSGLGTVPLYGGDVAISYPFTHWVTGVADFNLATTAGHVDSNIVGIRLDGTQKTYLFGPRVTPFRWRKLTPFGEALFGLAHAANGLYDTSSSQTSFAWQVGGGIDIRLNSIFSIRAGEVDFLRTNFSEIKTGSQVQNGLRASTGIVLHF